MKEKRAEFIEKYRQAPMPIQKVWDFESDLDALLKQHAIKFAQFTWGPLGILEAEVYDEWINDSAIRRPAKKQKT